MGSSGLWDRCFSIYKCHKTRRWILRVLPKLCWLLTTPCPRFPGIVLLSVPEKSWARMVQERIPFHSRQLVCLDIITQNEEIQHQQKIAKPKDHGSGKLCGKLFISCPRSMKKRLGKYQKHFPDRAVYDLSQSLRFSRKSLKNGEMPCLARSSTHLWNQNLNRCYTGKEKLKSLLYPVEGVDLSGFSERTLTQFAGNGMHLPSVGWAFLMQLLCVSPTTSWHACCGEEKLGNFFGHSTKCNHHQ